jgi:hypothetical protein
MFVHFHPLEDKEWESKAINEKQSFVLFQNIYLELFSYPNNDSLWANAWRDRN